ncbi:apolipo protein O-domain-containing protein [Tuber brumale]|nr:apolipo protein O-domain-containing protein [Tuber brumale]
MVFRLSSRRTAVITLTTIGAIASTITPVFADEGRDKKSIYDTPPTHSHITTTTPTSADTKSPSLITTTPTPTPTDRLAAEIRKARLFLHVHTVLLQKHIDLAFSKYLSYEHSITSTISSLVPPKSSEEKVVPGVLYVAVSTMAGSIITRNRMLPIRALTPVFVGIGAGWYFLPETTRNVGDLVWEWEKMVPEVAEKHLLVRRGIEEAVEASGKVARDGRRVVNENVSRGRSIVEGWVKKG